MFAGSMSSTASSSRRSSASACLRARRRRASGRSSFSPEALFGVLLVLPIGGADMPVVISLLNAFTGLAAASTGFVPRTRR